MTCLIRFYVIVAISLFHPTHAAVINHDAVPVWPEPVPEPGSAEEIAVKFKPMLHVYNGCQPYPVVDRDGNTGGGLKPKGDYESGCRDRSKGQVYSRSGWYKDSYAVMYSWYFPKDQATRVAYGHRHDWEGVVVWLSTNTTDAHVVAASVSVHSEYEIKSPVSKKYIKDDITVRVGYKQHFPLDHRVIFSKHDGSFQPLIQWEQMTDAAKNALSTTSFGKADVMFTDWSFEKKLAKAYFK